jgi:hypothetical protein
MGLGNEGALTDEQQPRHAVRRAETERPAVASRADFLSRLNQAEERDTGRMGGKVPQLQPTGGRALQLPMGPDGRPRTPHKTGVARDFVRQQKMPAKPLAPKSPPGWAMSADRRNTKLIGTKIQPSTWESPHQDRIRRMLASAGGSHHHAFFASETNKYNSAQPNARRNQHDQSSILIGDPSPQEKSTYVNWMFSVRTQR